MAVRQTRLTGISQSKNFNTPHQVIGIIVLAGLLVQFCLGFFHHRTYKKTKQTTKLRPYHVWLGRAIIPLGVLNGFLYVWSLSPSPVPPPASQNMP